MPQVPYAEKVRLGWPSVSSERTKDRNRRMTIKKQQALKERMAPGCRVCGVHEDLQFHHRAPRVDGDGQFPISMNVSKKGLSTLLAEADKCDVLCVPCHHQIHV